MRRQILIMAILFLAVAVSAQEIKTHTVKSGETITSICELYGISREELTSINPSVKNYVYTGQILKIPAKDLTQLVAEETTEEVTGKETKPEELVVEASNIEVESVEAERRQFSITSFETASFGFMYLSKPKGQDLPWGISSSYGQAYGLNLTEKTFLSIGTDFFFELFNSIYSERTDFSNYMSTSSSTWKIGLMMPVMMNTQVGPLYVGWGCYGQYALFGGTTTSTSGKLYGESIDNEEKVSLSKKHGSDRFSYGVIFRIITEPLFGVIPLIVSFRVQYQPGGGEPIKVIGI